MAANRSWIRLVVALICGALFALTMASESRGDATPAISSQEAPPSVARCILLSASLCRAVHQKSTFALVATQTAVITADGITTRQAISRGYVEIDPATRVLIGRRPTWSRMAPLGTVQVVAETWLSQRMKDSKHPWLRRVWWLPLVVGIAGNSAGTIDNITRR